MTLSLFLLLLSLSVLFVEGGTELICKSVIFERVRHWFSGLGDFYAKLISCGYCTSVWVAALPAYLITFLIPIGLLSSIGCFVFLLVVIHRMSNYLHNFNDKYLDKYYSNKSE